MRSVTTAPDARDTACAKALERLCVVWCSLGRTGSQQWLEVINGKLGETDVNFPLLARTAVGIIYD